MLRRQFALGAGALLASGGAAARAAGQRDGQRGGRGEGKDGGGQVPFDFLLERQILLPIRLNGRPAEAWLDSGASASLVDAHFADALGLAVSGGELRASGVSKRIAGVRSAEVELTVGPLAWGRRRVAVMDLGELAAVLPRPAQVILGRDLFEEAAVEVDFAARRLRLTPRRSFRAPEGPALPLRAAGGLKRFPMVVAGVPTWAVLDLGNAGALMLDRGFAEAYGLLQGRRVSTLMSVGADGPRESQAVSLDGVGLGGMSFDGVPVDLVTDPASKVPANVGLGLLSRFRLTLDFGGGRLWMAPAADAASRPFRKNRSGLSTARDGERLQVTFVAAGSPAERAGWKVGEAIAAVDGQAVGEGFALSPAALFSFGPAGRTVELRLEDGTRRRLTLADYY